ncbi:hypothetical protein TNCV_1019711 [Trichonephila clavipes]|nr:hypothetical protein TNCV_1019711 [Trichonephila clavipes]
MPPNTLRVHTECVLIKSVLPKVQWRSQQKPQVQSAGEYFPPLQSMYLNYEGGDTGVAIYRVEVKPVTGSGKFPSFPF